MAILTGAFSARRFKLIGNLDLRPDTIAQALERDSFPVSWTGLGQKSGWVAVDNLLSRSFTENRDWVAGDYYVFSFRVDTRRIPSNVLKAHVAQACAAWLKEVGSSRVPGKVRRELRESVINQLTPGIQSVTRTYDVALNIRDQTITFGGLSPDLLRRFVKAFSQTFKASIEPMHPMGSLPEIATSRQFYLWLWWAADTGAPLGVENVTLAKRICLTDKDASTTIAADDVQAIPEARMAALAGRRPTQLKLNVTMDSQDFTFSLQGADLDIHGLKIPEDLESSGSSQSDNEAAIIDRMGAYERLYGVIEDWSQRFRETTEDAKWETECADWLKGRAGA